MEQRGLGRIGSQALLDADTVLLEYALGEPNMNRRQRVGFRLPLARTATGRACIAAMNPEQRERALERLRLAYPDEWHLLREESIRAMAGKS